MFKKIVSLFFYCLFVFTTVSAKAENTATVTRVVDGDTIKVMYEGHPDRIRFIGVDTPESFPNRKAYKDSRKSGQDIDVIVAQGQSAKKFTQGILPKGQKVLLEFDVEPRDRYKRILAYVYLPDGRMVNEVIIKEGYASPMTIPPNVKYQKRFLTAYQYARDHNKGLWADKQPTKQTNNE